MINIARLVYHFLSTGLQPNETILGRIDELKKAHEVVLRLYMSHPTEILWFENFLEHPLNLMTAQTYALEYWERNFNCNQNPIPAVSPESLTMLDNFRYKKLIEDIVHIIVS